MRRIKQADKKKAGLVVTPLGFQQHFVKAEPQQGPSEGPTTRRGDLGIESKPTVTKRKLDEPFARPDVKQTINPYAKKKVSQDSEGSFGRVCGLKQELEVPSTAGFLKLAESEAYFKPREGEIVKSIRSNAPHTSTCPCCSSECKEPFVAECRHVACLSCWLDWLNRNKTCMTCRAPATKDSLARVVYERKPGSGAPSTLSQLCADNDSEDELEIC
jgi:hypothetical protein